MSKLVKVLERKDLADATAKTFVAEGKSLAIFRVGEEFFAMDNKCLHRGGPIGEGELDGYRAICPWHGWTYDVRSGAFSVIPTLRVKTYPVVLQGDDVFVEL